MPNNGLNDEGGVFKIKQIVKFETPDAMPSHQVGGTFYDPGALTLGVMTGITDVINQVGQEDHELVYNDTGVQINNGQAVYRNGVALVTFPDAVDRYVPTVALAKADTLLTSVSVAGLATANIGDESLGLVTQRGLVRDFKTDHLSPGLIFLSATTAGAITSTMPDAPGRVIVMGGLIYAHLTDGIVLLNIDKSSLERAFISKEYGFSTNGIGAGTYHIAGFYEAPAADVTLNQGSTTQTYGTANNPYAAHPFIVAGGAGTVDTGQVGLRVTGTSITDLGVRTASDTDVITDDITTLSLNDFLETKKFLGTVTFELYVVSGTPTTYSLDFNYGFAKYEDVGNRDFWVADIEVVGLAGANDTTFDVELLHHQATGWTYSATAFVPGSDMLAGFRDDMAPEANLATGESFAWKHTEINEFIHGNDSEGIVIRITAGATNSARIANAHVRVFVDPRP